MADFSFLSDSDESSTAVDDVLSQAMDQIVLEQVAAINCSGFTDSVLPTHLESRFRKLKSFPAATNPKSPSLDSGKNFTSSSFNSKSNHVKSPKTPKTLIEDEFKDSFEANPKSESLSDDEDVLFKPSKEDSEKEVERSKLGSESVHSSSKSSKPSTGSDFFSPKKSPDGIKMSWKSKSRGGSFSSPSNSWDSSMESPSSPPKRSGCFWCSPKRDSRKKNKENLKDLFASVDLDWDKNDEILSDLGTFSAKEQQKVLKKAMKEEEKISREAEKIVKWAKQASARMVVSGLEDDDHSDNESTK